MAEPKKFKRVFGAAMVSVAMVLATVSNVCVYAFGEVTSGSITAFLLEKYKGDESIIVFLMIANTVCSLSVLLSYPLQLFPTLELIGPKTAALWLEFRHGGKPGGVGDNEYDENDLSRFDPMPTLHEHESLSMGSNDKEHSFENFETTTDNPSSGSNSGTDQKLIDATRRSMVSNNTDSFPMQPTIPGDSLFLRVGLVLVTFLVAVIIPNVQVLISLAGALAGSSTALLIPPMLELALIDHLERKPDIASPKDPLPSQQRTPNTVSLGCLCQFNISGAFWKRKLKNLFLLCVGFIFMLIGAYASISDIISIWFSTEK